MTNSILFSRDEIQNKVKELANWADNTKALVCFITPSGFMLASDVSRLLYNPVEFVNLTRYKEANGDSGVFLYRCPDPSLYKGKTVILIDVITNSGYTLNFVQKLFNQLGAKRVLTAALISRQFTAAKPTWKGFAISDEKVYGYGIKKDGVVSTTLDIFEN